MPAPNQQPKRRRYTAIPLRILFYIAWRNLTHKKLRAFLTIFGVVIGIGAIFFLVSFGLGLQHLVTEQVVGNQSIKSIDVSSPNSKVLRLDQDGIDKMKRLPNVERLGASITMAGSLKSSGSEVDAVVYGLDADYQTLIDLSLVEGRLLDKEDHRQLVINAAGLDAVGLRNHNEAVGKQRLVTVPLKNAGATADAVTADFEIVGVVESGAGSEIFVPNFTFESVGVTAYSQVKLVADTSEHVAGLRSQIESLGYETTSPLDTIEQINQVFKIFNVVLAGFGAIGMVVAVLGMFNTLTISLLERTKEIGLMIALGARNSDMRKLFIFEAVLLSLVGALIGILFATVMGMIVNVIMNRFAARRGVAEAFDLFATPPVLIAAMITFMVVIGLLVVFFPARRAQKISPIDALRRE